MQRRKSRRTSGGSTSSQPNATLRKTRMAPTKPPPPPVPPPTAPSVPSAAPSVPPSVPPTAPSVPSTPPSVPPTPPSVPTMQLPQAPSVPDDYDTTYDQIPIAASYSPPTAPPVPDISSNIIAKPSMAPPPPPLPGAEGHSPPPPPPPFPINTPPAPVMQEKVGFESVDGNYLLFLLIFNHSLKGWFVQLLSIECKISELYLFLLALHERNDVPNIFINIVMGISHGTINMIT